VPLYIKYKNAYKMMKDVEDGADTNGGGEERGLASRVYYTNKYV